MLGRLFVNPRSGMPMIASGSASGSASSTVFACSEKRQVSWPIGHWFPASLLAVRRYHSWGDEMRMTEFEAKQVALVRQAELMMASTRHWLHAARTVNVER